jgi:probable sporulation protein (polysaccharide deacetylase family)
MKFAWTCCIRQWYVMFSTAIFLFIAMLSGLVPLPVVIQDMQTPQPLFHGDLQAPKVAFACNVFWGEEYIPAMLATFDATGSKITFFIGGSWAKRYPAIVTEIAARGHELANHSYSHPHPNTLNKEQNKEQITKTEELIRELSHYTTRLYAPPYGEYNNTVLQAAAELNYTTIMWSIDTIDWQKPSPAVIKQRVVKKLHNGAIILIHPTQNTAQALPDLIATIQEKGYTIVPVSDIINCK